MSNRQLFTILLFLIILAGAFLLLTKHMPLPSAPHSKTGLNASSAPIEPTSMPNAADAIPSSNPPNHHGTSGIRVGDGGEGTNSATPTVSTSSDEIHVISPKPGDTVDTSKSLIVKGEARGNWFFEASFPVVVVDWDGKIIGQGHAEAQSDWMTGDFVPFSGKIDFAKPDISVSTRGAIIFKNDNPSGDPARQKSVEIPILFK